MGSVAPQEKLYWSYEQIQSLIWRAVVEDEIFKDFQPTLMICIAAGGFVPTRMLRCCLKHKLGHQVPIQTIGLQLYDTDLDPATSPVQRVQWLSYGTAAGQVQLQGHRVLIVDEVDDSRKTLSCAVTELLKDVEAERQQHEATQPDTPWQEPQLGIFVVHNKQVKKKLAQLPEDIMQHRYFAATEVPDVWCVYPWDATDIYAHTATAESGRSGGSSLQSPHNSNSGSNLHSKRQSSGCPPVSNGAAGSAGAGTNGHAAGLQSHELQEQPESHKLHGLA